MGGSTKSTDSSISIIGEVLDEINKYAIGEVSIYYKGSKKINKKIDKLDDSFWEYIRTEIATMLTKNYNSIRTTNSQKYNEWKKRAREEGLNIIVSNSGTKKPVIYIRPGLRTGALREKLKDVRIVNNDRVSNRSDGKSITYEVDISDLFKNYGTYFSDLINKRTGQDIFLLREDQVQEILEKILSKVISEI